MAVDNDNAEESVENEEQSGGESNETTRAKSKLFGPDLKIKLKYSLLSCLITAAVMLAYFLLKDTAMTAKARELVPEKTVVMNAVDVSLGDTRNRLKIKLALETKGGEQERWLRSKQYLLTDLLIQMAQKKRASDLNNEVMQNKFKRELLDEFNYRLDPNVGRITRIYFAEFYIQPKYTEQKSGAE
jgi:flagellar basal body-associated protein FliL